ncbi:MAG: YgiT-type zinc finger protein [Ktedonobacterales bacterium]
MEETQELLCPRCGRGTLSSQMVDETVVVGNDAARVTTNADVCSFCGEHWFGPEATALFDEAIRKLREHDVSHLTPIGELYRAS